MSAPYHLIFEKSDSFKDYFLFNEENSLTYLPNFNVINIIVGANNSGKSRFIRHLMSFSNLRGIDVNVSNQYNDYVDQYNKHFKNQKHLSLQPIRPDRLDVIDSNKLFYVINKVTTVHQIKKGLIECETKMFKSTTDPKRYYIPTLRTAHSLYTTEPDFKRLDEDIYHQTLKYYYVFDKKLNVFTGMTLYENILNSRNSEKVVRNRFEEFEKFLSENFFNGKQIDIVAKFNKGENKRGKSDSELILIHVQDETHTRKLYELGDGIQALIILMYKIFMSEDNSLFFIDEPELNLHPGMQRLFLEQIAANPELIKKNLTYVISTHSNHFLDLTLEKNNVSIYSFAPKVMEDGSDKQFVIKNVNRGDNDLLKHLGVNNSSVFLANCSIWLEGVSDRNYIKAFLKAYLKHLSEIKSKDYKSIKEDIDYAFFEYAGSNIEHYIFEDIDEIQQEEILSEINALALSNRIFLLADSDNADGRTKKGKRLKNLEDNLKDNFIPKIIREVREIENLLTNNVWDKILVNFCNKKLVDKEKDLILERITDALKNNTATDNKKDYIGFFLNKIDLEVGSIHGTNILNKIYEVKDGKYGTFIQKRELSEYVLEANFSWDVFKESPQIVELTESIYKFIIDSRN